jgi:hypothetical protein
VEELLDAIRFLQEFKHQHPAADKAALQQAYLDQFRPQTTRSLFLGDGYAIRFSEVMGASFANTVLSLSALKSVDHEPVVVCAVYPRRVRFLLANSSFLRKVSHSSLHLRIDNVRGSFNGTDILMDYGHVANLPEHFAELFAIHAAFEWDENLERLVEATNAIVAQDRRFRPDQLQRRNVMDAPVRSSVAIASPSFGELDAELRATVLARRAEILRSAALDNVNLRGNRIERIVTGGSNEHGLGDLHRDLPFGNISIDVKSKLLGRHSAPKAYNVDKMLAFLAQPNSIFAFLMIGLEVDAGSVTARLVSVFDEVLLDATVVQHHWAGRTSRGVTQLTGGIDRLLAPGYDSRIDLERAREFLARLLAE